MSRRKKPNTQQSPESSKPAASSNLRWYRADLHLHTPASSDYEEPQVTYLEWLRQARAKKLDIVAITDHNTVAGVAAIRQEIEWLTRLEAEGRLTAKEKTELEEWRSLANEIVVLPGFEFTATFGFHILGLFPPDTDVRQLEHVLLSLNVPSDKLDAGSTETGASTDVLRAYQVITEAGGLAIAAHANSTHGVAMRNFPFGGQTKIAYTQDPNLAALEVTDLESRSRRATARFFNGSKPEYPRRMHCIQGSDAHRLVTDPKNPKRLGIGERVTELLLPEPTFEAIRDLFHSKHFDRVRPYRPKDQPLDQLAAARKEGPSQTQSFHESASKRGGRLTAILADICAFANTDGGTIYVGASARKGPPKGLANPKAIQDEIQAAMNERLTPPMDASFDVIQSDSAKVLRINVEAGQEKPYCLDGSKFYVRDEAETSLAVRDEIVALVMESLGLSEGDKEPVKQAPAAKNGAEAGQVTGAEKSSDGRRRSRRRPRSSEGEKAKSKQADDDPFYLPQMGVEVVAAETRGGSRYYIVRDLRNGRTVSNVTRSGARKLWNYAITQHEDHPLKPEQITWKGNVGLVRMEKRAGKRRYDLALREGKNIRVFYGVTEDGMEGSWAQFVEKQEPSTKRK